MKIILDDWIENMNDGLHVFFSPAINGHSNSEEDFTENITWFIFSNESWSKKNKFPIKNYIGRSISINSANKAEISSSLEKFYHYSCIENCSIQYWLDRYSFSTLEGHGLLPCLLSVGTNKKYKTICRELSREGTYKYKLAFNCINNQRIGF